MVEWPGGREELLRYVRLMADPEEAHTVWVEGKLPEGYHFDSFTDCITFFFDDNDLQSKEAAIGNTLKNEQEWKMMLELRSKMELVFDTVGSYAPDEEYLSHKKWSDVIAAAGNVLAVWDFDQ